MFICAWSFFQNQYFDDVIYENGTAAYIYYIYAPPPTSPTSSVPHKSGRLNESSSNRIHGQIKTSLLAHDRISRDDLVGTIQCTHASFDLYLSHGGGGGGGGKYAILYKIKYHVAM